MEPWRSQHFKKFAISKGSDLATVDAAIAIGKALQVKSPNCQPIFSLKHLAYSADVKYKFLREVVERSTEDKYRVFKIHKRGIPGQTSKRFRIICAPDPQLMKMQKWIARNILAHGRTHDASVAYQAGSNIVDAASLHCGCRWLIKLDIINFFESVTEQNVFRVFSDMGYQPLVAFELARICTRKGSATWRRNRAYKKWRTRNHIYTSIHAYSAVDILGHLPQGAPTSPMLANLAMVDFDKSVEDVANSFGLTYTRYADDLTFSTKSDAFSREVAQKVISEVYKVIRRFSFEPNLTKTQVVPPGARRVVLGLLVDGPTPQLSKKFRNQLRRHLHHVSADWPGVVEHAEKNHFQSVFGLRNHIEGLIAFAHSVDPEYAKKAWEKFAKIDWPQA
ncbi:reverse transcriptase family protein [Poseidonocella sedimentorum]|uniref:RNA-directed DNA polymerase n=1 Tax=Poseidonocella sedimentorum TaxID=871652 RepID=A0A1I6EN10_9RHOB|nr:reverse transcriptase family protein [Poseidonocella sedimentorum]SFR18908.1 Reverse transcriptase (RNA-dependent DNA polymerase) [Poseidonocella sedimentorum]